MKIDKISVPKNKAKELWLQYHQAITEKNYKYLKEMKSLYFHLKNGRKVIDIYEAFKNAGLNQFNQPKLAISRADKKEVFVELRPNGSCKFSDEIWKEKWSVYLPEGTFTYPETLKFSYFNPLTYNTKVPIVPPLFLPRSHLRNYHILFEVENWKSVTKDPILIKRITRNLFVILAFWNLSPLEKALIKGR